MRNHEESRDRKGFTVSRKELKVKLNRSLLRAQKEGFHEEGRVRKGFAVSQKEFKVNLNRLRQSAERRVS